jgi:hypothetical protein
MPSYILIVHGKYRLLCQSQDHSHLVLPGEDAGLVIECELEDSAGERERGDEDVSVVPESAYCCDNDHSGFGIRVDDQGGVGSKEVVDPDKREGKS